MLQSKRGSPWIAVSPDAKVAGTVNSPNGLPQEEEEKILFVELKTRQKNDTIFRAKGALERW